MIIGITGHRQSKLPYGYKLPNPCYIYVCQELDRTLKQLNSEKVITGMCTGVDQWMANICIKLNIPFVAAIPFEGQEKRWSKSEQDIYFKLLNKASEIIIVSSGGYSAQKMQIRNQYIVDNCDLLIAVYNGTSGGTKNTIDYAKTKHKRIVTIDPARPSYNDNV